MIRSLVLLGIITLTTLAPIRSQAAVLAGFGGFGTVVWIGLGLSLTGGAMEIGSWVATGQTFSDKGGAWGRLAAILGAGGFILAEGDKVAIFKSGEGLAKVLADDYLYSPELAKVISEDMAWIDSNNGEKEIITATLPSLISDYLRNTGPAPSAEKEIDFLKQVLDKVAVETRDPKGVASHNLSPWTIQFILERSGYTFSSKAIRILKKETATKQS